MQLRKAIKVGLASAALPALALAAQPGFDGWSMAANGVITTSGAGSAAMSEAGFLQRTVTDSNGQSYIQTIIADAAGIAAGAGGSGGAAAIAGGVDGFSSETFVAINATDGSGNAVISGGLAAYQVLGENGTAGERMVSKATLKTDTFEGTGDRIHLTNDIIDGTTAGNLGGARNFGSTFDMVENSFGDLGNAQTATKVDLTIGSDVADATFKGSLKLATTTYEAVGAQTIGMTVSNSKKLDADSSLNDGAGTTQTFALRERTGGAVISGGAATYGATSGNFNAGDTIVSLKIAQDIAGAGTFSLHDFANETTPAESFGVDSMNGFPAYTTTYTASAIDPFTAMP
ncbi:MAG: hypothetical protein HY940_03975 [Gammaproteobacteria bacterium]|nr:hypothetical protein [Gammaproteobacteria bacterium]